MESGVEMVMEVERSVKGSEGRSVKERKRARQGKCNDLIMSELNYDSCDIIRAA
jgi:hypothetical protein